MTWCLLSLFYRLLSFKIACEAAQIFYWDRKNLKALGNTRRGYLTFNQGHFPLRTVTKNTLLIPNFPAEGFCFERGPLFGKRVFLCRCTHRSGNLGGASFFLTQYCLITQFYWHRSSASHTECTGAFLDEAEVREVLHDKAGEWFNESLLAPATRSEVLGLDQNNSVALFSSSQRLVEGVSNVFKGRTWSLS